MRTIKTLNRLCGLQVDLSLPRAYMSEKSSYIAARLAFDKCPKFYAVDHTPLQKHAYLDILKIYKQKRKIFR